MKRLNLFLVIGTAAVALSSCQKEMQTTQQSNQTGALNQSNVASAHGYGGAFIYNIELSANIPGVQGGGLWLWIGLHSDGSGDYSGSDCGHGGAGAASDKGDASWHYVGLGNTGIEIDGIVLNGLDGFVTTITVPSKVGHYTGTIGTYVTLPDFIPPFLGSTQLTVAP